MGVAKQKLSAQMRYAAGCMRRSADGTSTLVIKREGVRGTANLDSRPIRRQVSQGVSKTVNSVSKGKHKHGKEKRHGRERHNHGDNGRPTWCSWPRV